MDLILDVKIIVALVSDDVWTKLVLLDDEFYQYACTKEGITLFVKQFTKKEDDCTYLFNKLHSINDEPAEMVEKNKYWYYNGLRHRDNDLPARIDVNGNKYWYYNGNFHRKNDLPAIIYANGDKHWYCHEKLHRENDLPAIIYNNGTKYWYKNDELHRKNFLPEVIYANGDKFWFYNGIMINLPTKVYVYVLDIINSFTYVFNN